MRIEDSSMNDRVKEIIEFWIGAAATDPQEAKARGKLWYQSTPESDERLRQQFGEELTAAESGALDHWAGSPAGSLALVILLDQFSRNLYRGTAGAFGNDDRALSVAIEAIDKNQDRELSTIGRAFLYHPFEHSEQIEMQDRSVALFEQLLADAEDGFKSQVEGFLDYAREHREVVRKFGRFPHRNAVLGREDTAGEKEYLEGGGSRYGQ